MNTQPLRSQSFSEQPLSEMHLFCQSMQMQICAGLETLEPEGDKTGAKFEFTPWDFHQEGGGRRGLLRGGRTFAKAGVNVCHIKGVLPVALAREIPGGSDSPHFEACGLSLVIHPRNPHVPIVHMNIRQIMTTKRWFGGGMDLTPAIEYPDDTHFFHQQIKQVCDHHSHGYYSSYKSWCDRYFYLPHRKEARGVGGIFFDDLSSGDFQADYAFVQAVAKAFLPVYMPIVQQRMDTPCSEADYAAQMKKRARYVEFNLLYDRGTQFGLKTGGDSDAILMSLPPDAGW